MRNYVKRTEPIYLNVHELSLQVHLTAILKLTSNSNAKLVHTLLWLFRLLRANAENAGHMTRVLNASSPYYAYGWIYEQCTLVLVP